MQRFLILLLLLSPEIATAADYRLLRFTATWCGPCHNQQLIFRQPQIQAVMRQHGIKDVPVDIDRYPRISKQWNIRSVPTTILVDVDPRDGKAIVIRRRNTSMTAVQYKSFVTPP